MSGRPTISSGSRGVAADGLRRHNLGLVLETIHLQGTVSRSQLTASTGLNRSTIGDLIGELTGHGLVEEMPAVAGSRPGRPSPLVQPRAVGAVVLALEVSVDSVAAATVGLGGHVFERRRIARVRGRVSPDETVHDLAELAQPLLAALPADHRLAGIGAAVVGVVRRRDGFVHVAPNLGWRDVPLGSMLGAALGRPAPVDVANDADLGALAEHRRLHPGVGHLVYVSGEVGIGIGVIVDGKPLLGAAGYAGEAGHTLINPAGLKCRCGSVGCWETEAGEAALLRRAGMRSRSTGLGVVDALVERAGLGDEATRHAIDDVGRWLGLGLGNLINLFNPQVVVLGGLYQRLFPFLEVPVRSAIRLRALSAPGDSVQVVASGLGADAVLVGAAELALTRVIEDPARVGSPVPV